MRSMLRILLVITAIVPALAAAGESPIKGGGPFGVGLVFGSPGDWGVSGKIWIDEKNAFQPAVKLGGGVATLQMDYLWHTYDLIKPTQGKVPFYFGVGGDLILQNVVAVGARGVAGLSYMFDRTDVPVDIFVQLAPTLWFFNGFTDFYVYGEVGSRFYF